MPKVPSLLHQLLIDPDLAMIAILPAEPIITQQKTPPRLAVHHMHNRNLIRRKHLDTRNPSQLLTSTSHSSTA